LPGAESLDIPRCLATLDRWTCRVQQFASQHAHRFNRDPAAFEHQHGLFLFLCLVTVLKHSDHVGVGYSPSAIGNYNFSDSRDDFLHGVLTRKLGTCISLPVLFVAIGRRLRWPLHLAIAKRHVFCQWLHGHDTHLNLEGSCPGGGKTYPDSHYATWPAPLTQDELRSGRFLRPLTRHEEFALFLETRGHCLADNGRYGEAREAYGQAHQVSPNWSLLSNHLHALSLQEMAHNYTCSPFPDLISTTSQ
jgi:hypothetical protein